MRAGVYDFPELRGKTQVFADRREGGQALARMLAGSAGGDAVICALPAGGVPVALPIAAALGLELRAAAVSKITLPWNTESGYGAAAFDGTVRLNDELVGSLGLTASQVEEGRVLTLEKVRRRRERLEAERLAVDGKERSVIIVDDGLASGMTMLTAIEALRKSGAAGVSAAVPTGLQPTVDRVALEADAVYCPNIRSRYPFAVAEAYRRWADVAEAEAFRLMREWNRKRGVPPGGMQ